MSLSQVRARQRTISSAPKYAQTGMPCAVYHWQPISNPGAMRRPSREPMQKTARTLRIALLAASLTAASAFAADLKIGLAADVSSLDPHYLNIAPNISLSSH